MAMRQPLNFGQLLRRHRTAAGLTQEALAQRAGVSVRGISDLERGVRRAPYLDTIELLAHALQLSASERATFAAASGRQSPGDFARPLAESPGVPGGTSSPLVGRASELALLASHLATAGPGVLLLAGEPGIGKTRLLRETAMLAREGGWTVLEGGCHRRGGNEPYAPLLGALEGRLRHQSPPRMRADLEGCTWLASLLPELGEATLIPAPQWVLPPEQERRLVFRAVGRFLANVAGPAGTLLVLDDLQWAGADALDLLATLLRTPAETELRVVAAYRDTEVHLDAPLAELLADLARDGLARQIALGPLTPDEAVRLFVNLLEDASDTNDTLVERVVERAGGVPFFLVSCAQALRMGALEAGTAEGIPWDVAQNIRQRVVALPRVAQELLAVVAVAGGPVPGALLMQVAGEQEIETLLAIESACQARLLAGADDDNYHFAHDLIADVVARDLSARRRKLLHKRIAEALERQPGDPPVDQLAYHFARAGDLMKEIEYLDRAGDRAHALLAPAEAEGYYRKLVELLERRGETRRAAAYGKLGGVLLAQARFDQAADAFERAAAHYRAASDHEAVAQALARVAQARSFQGDPDKAIAQLRQGLDDPDGLSPQAQAVLYAQLTYPLFRLGRYEEALSAAEQAAECARSAHADTVLQHAEIRRAFTLGSLGRLQEAKRVLEAVLAVTQRSKGNEANLYSTLTHLSVTCASLGEYELSLRYAERALATAESVRNPNQVLVARSNRGWSAYLLGAWRQARADLEYAISLGQQIGASWAAPYPLLNLGIVCLAEGQPEIADDCLQRGLALAEQTKDVQLLRWAQQELAEADLLSGHPEMARARLEPLLDGADTGNDAPTSIDVVGMLPPLAWAYLELGDEERATALLAWCLRRARAGPLRPVMVAALRVRSLLAIRQRRWRTAEAALRRVLACARAMPSPYDEAKLHYTYGLLHLHRGECEPARHRFEETLVLCARLGERLYAERIERALGREG